MVVKKFIRLYNRDQRHIFVISIIIFRNILYLCGIITINFILNKIQNFYKTEVGLFLCCDYKKFIPLYNRDQRHKLLIHIINFRIILYLSGIITINFIFNRIENFYKSEVDLFLSYDYKKFSFFS